MRMEMGDGRKGMVRGERIRWKMGERRRGCRWEIEFKGWWKEREGEMED